MLRRLICRLDGAAIDMPRAIHGDMLHGVLMENIRSDYANELHTQKLNPYSQYLEICRDGLYWVIQTLTQEAGRQIIEPLAAREFSNFHLDRLDRDIAILDKRQTEIPLKDLVSRFYFDRSDRLFRIQFLTPTAFKSGGEYIFYPDLRLLFGSLMRKYGAVCENSEEEDTQTLDSLVGSSKIVRYDLKSVYGEIGRVRLPAFRGMIVVKASGPQPLVNYQHFLLRFGEYAGAGIKCAMGMGAMRIIDRPAKEEV